MTTSTVAPQIAAFARAVRDALADLPEEERDELTEGLEADLSEAYAEDLSNTLPDPVEYAAELRSAAGLPQRQASRSGLFAEVVRAGRNTARDVLVAVRGNAAAASLLDFLAALRPFWWVVRAWVAAWCVSTAFGYSNGFVLEGGWMVGLAVFVVVSVQWGRGRWTFPSLRPAVLGERRRGGAAAAGGAVR